MSSLKPLFYNNWCSVFVGAVVGGKQFGFDARLIRSTSKTLGNHLQASM